ncbi:ribosomal protein S18-alanine N-acetyltransferase [Neptunicella marina]
MSLAKPAYDLYCRFQAYPMSYANFLSCLSGKYFAFVAYQNEQLVGLYLAHQVLDELTLIEVGVAPEYRGKGYGKALMQHFEQQGVKRGAQQFWLEVRESNHIAIALYQSLDFSEIEIRKNYYPSENGHENAVVMSKFTF